MKALFKVIARLIVPFFNVSLYQLSDGIDSLVLKLKFIGLKQQANRIMTLSEVIEYQQGVIILLDSVKCLFMLLSLVFFFLANQATFRQYFKKRNA
ncbi:hypothetical protein [Aureispira anguillae]|uniref:Uncharacterized protein n=1 Tax=Aureispira anguillae TaxID=2864201 RepID=A0A915YGZ2_9BACT|nr:hypothetical protein [Aureispira anguillae]BDS12995.1 hypothetical protein AsAng_0037230 [Aureispira anguillae]BDS13058.1 hypothetical protein AsAng_0037860 [Aureispira anguillae]